MTNKSAKLIILIMVTVVVISLTVINAFADTIGRELVVDESKVLKNTKSTMYGTNFEWSNYSYNLVDSNLNTNTAFLQGMSGYKMPFNRMAGSTSSTFQWKNLLGAKRYRIPTGNGESNYSYLGIIEWVKAIKTLDSESEFIYVPNLCTDTMDNLRDLVEYLTGNPQNDINGGTNWAQKRVDSGVTAPVNIIWELGNELDWYSNTKWTSDQYIIVCSQAIDIIRSIDSDAKIACHADTKLVSDCSDANLAWHRAVLRALGDKIDYIALHSYYPKSKVYNCFYTINTIRDDILAITGSDRIKLIISEHATYVTETQDENLTHSMYGIVSTADFYLRLMRYSYVESANYHCFGPSPWATTYLEDGLIKPTAISDLQKLFMDYTCGDSLDSSLTGFNAATCAETTDFLNGVTKTDDGINIVFVNRNDTTDYNVSMSFNKNYRLVETRTITGNDYTSDNWYGKNDISVTTNSYNSINKFNSYTVPKLSVVALKLKRIQPANKFTDNFDSYNLKKVFSVANSVDSDLNYWKIMINNGKVRYNGFFSNRIVNGANAGDLETLKAENENKYNTFYGNGAYEGAAYNNCGLSFNYNGVPVTTGLPNWYGYVTHTNQTQECIETRCPLNVVTDVGNTSNQVLQMGMSYISNNASSVFGRYDLDLTGFKILKAKIKFPSVKQAKSFKICLTQGDPTCYSETTNFYGSDITATDSTSAANTLLNLVSGDLVGKQTNFTFKDIVRGDSFNVIYDAITFSEGKIYFGTNKIPVGEYEPYSSNWYTVSYYIDNRGENTKTGLTIVDADGRTVVSIPISDFTDTAFISLNSGSNIYGLQLRYTGYNQTTDTLPNNSNLYSQTDYWMYGLTRVYIDDLSLADNSAIGISNISLENAHLNVSVGIDCAENVEGNLIVAVYNKNTGMLEYIGEELFSAVTGFNQKVISLNVDNNFNCENCLLKCFYWRSLSTMKPVY